MAQEARERAVNLRKSLKQEMSQRRPSFSEAEEFVLRGLLLDTPPKDEAKGETADDTNSAKELSDEVLFSLPTREELSIKRAELPAHHKPAKRRSTLGLWKAFEGGFHPAALLRKAAIDAGEDRITGREITSRHQPTRSNEDVEKSDENDDEDVVPDEDADIASDVEVRRDSKSDVSVASSWDEGDHQDNFDTWEVRQIRFVFCKVLLLLRGETHARLYSSTQVLKDEYAEDFGFNFSSRGVSLEDILSEDGFVDNTFSILGTSADDKSVQPHVLSPPLMDALMSFVPDECQGENFWLRYSLVRDGASLDTLRNYVRAATFTIIAIETPTGEVFGSFTSSPWRTNMGYFGAQPCFVWKMRHNRRSHCSSLFEQAQLESEIDVYMCTHKKELIQVCRHDQLAVGGDERFESQDVDLDQSGFAFSLESDLLIGTSSPCKSFTSPALVGTGERSQVFDVAGLEVWSFTPCFDVAAAQKLEMTKFFIESTMRSSTHSTSSRSSLGSPLNSNDLYSDRFYRRVGQDYESQERRNRWQYTNMMNPIDSNFGPAGLQASPRFT